MRTLKVQFIDLPKSETPIIAYCRKLLLAGECPQTRLEVYRGDRLDVIVKEIGLAAQLRVSEARFKLDNLWLAKFKAAKSFKQAA